MFDFLRGAEKKRTALTVSSLMIAEGEPSRVHFLLGTDSDLHDAVRETGRFVVHVLEEEHRSLGDRFAGLAPSPGGVFAGLEVHDGDYGPELLAMATRVRCRYEEGPGGTYHVLASGIVDSIELHDLARPLLYFRGSYRSLADPTG